jgi:hypothetical protein
MLFDFDSLSGPLVGEVAICRDNRRVEFSADCNNACVDGIKRRSPRSNFLSNPPRFYRQVLIDLVNYLGVKWFERRSLSSAARGFVGRCPMFITGIFDFRPIPHTLPVTPVDHISNNC